MKDAWAQSTRMIHVIGALCLIGTQSVPAAIASLTALGDQFFIQPSANTVDGNNTTFTYLPGTGTTFFGATLPGKGYISSFDVTQSNDGSRDAIKDIKVYAGNGVSANFTLADTGTGNVSPTTQTLSYGRQLFTSYMLIQVVTLYSHGDANKRSYEFSVNGSVSATDLNDNLGLTPTAVGNVNGVGPTADGAVAGDSSFTYFSRNAVPDTGRDSPMSS